MQALGPGGGSLKVKPGLPTSRLQLKHTAVSTGSLIGGTRPGHVIYRVAFGGLERLGDKAGLIRLGSSTLNERRSVFWKHIKRRRAYRYMLILRRVTLILLITLRCLRCDLSSLESSLTWHCR